MSEQEWLREVAHARRRHGPTPETRTSVLTGLREDLRSFPGLCSWIARRPIRLLLLADPTAVGLGRMGGHRLGPLGDSTIVLSTEYPRSDVLHTFLHELGHHVHLRTRDPRVDATIREAFAAKTLTVCPLAGLNRHEYFAESFLVHWVERETLEERDPVATTMVAEVLGLVGIGA